MKLFDIANLYLLGLLALDSLSIARHAAGAATVDLSKTMDPAQQLASGWIFGFPTMILRPIILHPDISSDTRSLALDALVVLISLQRAGPVATMSMLLA